MTAKALKRRSDERQQLLIYLKPQVAKALKARAIEEGTHAYLIVEKLLCEKLELPKNDG